MLTHGGRPSDLTDWGERDRERCEEVERGNDGARDGEREGVRNSETDATETKCYYIRAAELLYYY